MKLKWNILDAQCIYLCFVTDTSCCVGPGFQRAGSIQVVFRSHFLSATPADLFTASMAGQCPQPLTFYRTMATNFQSDTSRVRSQ